MAWKRSNADVAQTAVLEKFQVGLNDTRRRAGEANNFSLFLLVGGLKSIVKFETL